MPQSEGINPQSYRKLDSSPCPPPCSVGGCSQGPHTRVHTLPRARHPVQTICLNGRGAEPGWILRLCPHHLLPVPGGERNPPASSALLPSPEGAILGARSCPPFLKTSRPRGDSTSCVTELKRNPANTAVSSCFGCPEEPGGRAMSRHSMAMWSWGTGSTQGGSAVVKAGLVLRASSPGCCRRAVQ